MLSGREVAVRAVTIPSTVGGSSSSGERRTSRTAAGEPGIVARCSSTRVPGPTGTPSGARRPGGRRAERDHRRRRGHRLHPGAHQRVARSRELGLVPRPGEAVSEAHPDEGAPRAVRGPGPEGRFSQLGAGIEGPFDGEARGAWPASYPSSVPSGRGRSSRSAGARPRGGRPRTGRRALPGRGSASTHR